MSKLNYINKFKSAVTQRVLELLKSEFNIDEVDPKQFKFETPPDDKFGHLAFACFPLARVAKKAPPMIAQVLAEKWGTTEGFKNVVSTGPYLNFFFSPQYLYENLMSECIADSGYGENEIGAGKQVMLEYSSPNTNKPLHLGHGRNNLLGITLSKLLSKSGYDVVKANLVNDRGVHICKSMYAYQTFGKGETPESENVKGDKLVGDYYVTYANEEKKNPEILEHVQQMLRDWEAGDSAVRGLWQKMNSWVLSGFKETYQRMGVAFDKYYYESETYKGGREIILDAFEKGICDKEDNGAISIDLEKDKLGKKILLRGDGTSMYITQDINTTVTKFSDFNLDGCLFVVGNEQDNHFKILFKVLEKFGFDWASRCEHISYGMINLPEGKMKSREGTVVDLDNLMDEMKAMALEELKGRYASDQLAENFDAEMTAEAIGQAAIKYYILKANAQKDITFNPKESLSFDGATGPYLQYTHARISSIFRKGELNNAFVIPSDYAWSEEEEKLLVALSRYPDVMATSAVDRNPAALCTFVYEICRLFNKFYYEHKILKAEKTEQKDARLYLTRAVQTILKDSLNILGIVPLERM